MKKLLLFLALLSLDLAFNSSNLNAQVRRITGRVISCADGTPISGVSVCVQGTAICTSTDPNGNYAINVPAGGILTFNVLGFQNLTGVPGPSDNILNVCLTPIPENFWFNVYARQNMYSGIYQVGKG